MAAKLWMFTLRTSQTQVGSARFKKGDSLTMRDDDPRVPKFREDSKRWAAKQVNATRIPRRELVATRAPAPARGSVPISPKAQAAYAGLINRIGASADEVARLAPADRAGFHALVAGNVHHIGRHLAAIHPFALTASLTTPNDPPEAFEVDPHGGGDLDDDAPADAPVEPDADPFGIDDDGNAPTDPSPRELADPALDSAGPDAAQDAGASETATEARGDAPASNLGEDSGGKPKADPPATTPSAAAPPAPAVAEIDPVARLQAALLAPGEFTLLGLVELAEGAGLELPAALKKERTRNKLVAGIGGLLAARSAPAKADPPKADPPVTTPSAAAPPAASDLSD